MRKLLKDYPFKTWMPAAGRCEMCAATYVVKIVWVDESGTMGDVEYRVEHEEGCPERYDSETGINRGSFGDVDVAGWEYMDTPMQFRGLELYPLKSRANIGPCLRCERLVLDVPLILFLDEGRGGELDFCWECAEKIGIPKDLVEAQK